MAFDGIKYFVVWPQNHANPDDPNVWGRFLDSAGAPLGEPFELFATAFDGTNYLVTFKRRAPPTRCVFYPVARFSTWGGVPLAGADPRVTFGNGEYLLAWAEDGIRGAWVSTDGKVLDPLGVALSASL